MYPRPEGRGFTAHLVNLVQFLLLPLFLGSNPEKFWLSLTVPGLPSVTILDCSDCLAWPGLSLLVLPSLVWLATGHVAVAVSVAVSKRKALVYEY